MLMTRTWREGCAVSGLDRMVLDLSSRGSYCLVDRHTQREMGANRSCIIHAQAKGYEQVLRRGHAGRSWHWFAAGVDTEHPPCRSRITQALQNRLSHLTGVLDHHVDLLLSQGRHYLRM
jgi:hypothetical protein